MLDQQAVAAFAGHEGRAAGAAFERGFFRVQSQVRAVLGRAVTVETGLLEDGLNVAGEVHVSVGGEGDGHERLGLR